MKKFKLAVFDTREYDKENFQLVEKDFIQITYFKEKLNINSVHKSIGFDAVCIFVNDDVNADVLKNLEKNNIKLVLTRSVGTNQIDTEEAKKLNISVYNVPCYSPNSIAEFAVALLLGCIRKTHKTYDKVQRSDFTLDGLEGFNIYEKEIGVIGTGKIGKIFAQIMRGFGAKVLAYDLYPDLEWAKEQGVKYVSLEEIYQRSKIISLHSPLTKETYHLINKETLSLMNNGVVIINTSRGGLINTLDLIEALKSKKVLAAGLDVYENEQKYFFEKFQNIEDQTLKTLIEMENVLLAPHQSFYTEEALSTIYKTTIFNIEQFLSSDPLISNITC